MLHLYSDGEWFISAESREEAFAIRKRELGVEDEHGPELVQVDDRKPIRGHLDARGELADSDEPGASVVRRPAAWWAARGKGLLGCTPEAT